MELSLHPTPWTWMLISRIFRSTDGFGHARCVLVVSAPWQARGEAHDLQRRAWRSECHTCDSRNAYQIAAAFHAGMRSHSRDRRGERQQAEQRLQSMPSLTG
eukprot:scaffold119742_cov40-Tisochrysis_lutea.AAC.2